VTGSNWTLAASTADLAFPQPGSDFASSYREWLTSDARINITSPLGGTRWYVTAHVRVPTGQSWPSALPVYVIRTGDGTGSGSIAGPTNTPLGPLPLEGATPYTAFFNGTRARNNVPIRLRIEGLTASITAGSYQVDVVYTVSYTP
jgi:hypothetical protein